MDQSIIQSKKRLALSIIDFLSTSLKDGTLLADEAENIEVATTCIAEAFKVDPNDQAAVKDAVGTQPLINVFTVYEKMKATTGDSSKSTQPTPAATTGTANTGQPSPEAEKLKSAGNAAMQQKDYKTAIEKYTQAISYSPTNPIYLSNRAAAYSASGDHASAAADAEIAVAADPKYTKAWSRLGLAKFAMGDAKGAVEAYEMGIEYEGNGGSDAMKKGLETAKKELARMEAESSSAPEEPVDEGTRAAPGGMPDLSSLASMLGGGGGAGGGGAGGAGGMPDLSAIMNNPMLAGMARNIMSNPDAMSSIMNNPMIRNMMNQRSQGGGGGGGGGGGMPDMSQIQQMMQDPAIANLAQQFMGGMGRGGPPGGGGGAQGDGR